MKGSWQLKTIKLAVHIQIQKSIIKANKIIHQHTPPKHTAYKRPGVPSA